MSLSQLREVGKPIKAQPPMHGIVASAYPGIEDWETWKFGLQMCPENCVEASTWDPDCANWLGGEPPAKSTAAANLDCYEVSPFVIESPFECSTKGFQTIDYEGRARRQLEAATPKAMEYELWTGTLRGAGSPHLASPAATVFTMGSCSPVRGLALAGQALANCAHGGRGMIHAPQVVADLWAHESGSVIEDGGRLVTRVRRDIIVAGAGYIGTGPDGAPPPDGSAWIYATGPVQYWLNDVVVLPGDVKEAIDIRRNRIEYRAEREAMLAFDPCCHFAILVSIC